MVRTSSLHHGRLASVLGAQATPSRATPDVGSRGSVDVIDGPDTLPLPVSPPASLPSSDGPWRRLIGRLVPQSWRAARFDPGRPAATALVLVAALAAVVAAVGVWTTRPQAEPVSGLPAVVVGGDQPTTAPASTSSAAQGPPGILVVSVSGRVARPGLVRVPDGARVADVVAAAGGALPGADLTGLNLARRVSDGEQVAVGVPVAPDAGGAQPSGPSSGNGASTGSTAGGAGPQVKVDLNTATVTQLDALPGVGPVTAQHIVDWRTHNGRFAKIEQLREVDGIGEHRFQQLRDLVTV